MSEKESPHIGSLRSQDKLNRLATERFRVRGGKVEKYETGQPVTDIEQVVAAAVAAEKEAYAKRLAAASPGQMIEGHGIFLGVWEPRDRDGYTLKQKFNVFAAPKDLHVTLEYERAVRHVAGLRDWHGHDGASYANDFELYDALKKGAYKGGWFIPPSDLLSGRRPDMKLFTPDNLLVHKDKGDFNGTFTMERWGDDNPEFYWSSTQNRRHDYKVYALRLHNDYDFEFISDRARLSCRPVRLEPLP